MSLAMHLNMPKDGNSGSFGLVMAIFQMLLKAKTCSLLSLRGICLRKKEIFAFLIKGSVSGMMQKKQEQFVHVAVEGRSFCILFGS